MVNLSLIKSKYLIERERIRENLGFYRLMPPIPRGTMATSLGERKGKVGEKRMQSSNRVFRPQFAHKLKKW